MEQTRRVALVGAGVIADAHARSLRTIEGVKLAAVCDVAVEKAQALSRKFGIPEVFGSVDAMKQGSQIDAVHILLPPRAHADVSIQCLENGWDVFIEKPMAISVEQCAAIQAAVARSGRRAAVNHNFAFTPAFQRLLADIRKRRFGRVENAFLVFNFPLRQLSAGQHSNWIFQEPGNIVLELGAHAMSLITTLMGKVTAAQVAVTGEVTLSTGVPFFDNWQASLTCERGMAQCLLSVAKDLPDVQLYVVGQDASAVVDILRNTYRINEKTRFIKPVEDFLNSMSATGTYFAQGFDNVFTYLGGFMGMKPASDAYSIGMRSSMQSFHDAARRGVRAPVSEEEGAAVIQACDTIIEAGRRYATEPALH